MSDPITQVEKLHHVKEQLRIWSGRKGRTNDTWTFISCPFHNERTPSGQIFHGPGSRSPGYFRCLGCGHRCHWDELATAIGLQPFGKQPATDVYSVKLALSDEEEETAKFELHPLPKNKTWRTFDTKFLRKVGVQMMLTEWGTRMLYMPVLINGEERGYIKARLKKDPTGERPSYINSKGPWSKTHGLFPFDYAIQMMEELGSRTIVLVEGPRDALRLLSLGIPAMSILGTNTWSQRKAQLLELYGVEEILLMMDGDEAGMLAAERIGPDLASVLRVRQFRLWACKDSPYHEYVKLRTKAEQKAFKSKLWDPGNCPEELLLRIKRKFFKQRELE